jgi:RimJ/RimL family protein N-acetyltransferase
MKLNYRLAESKDLQRVFDLYMDPLANAFLTFDAMDLKEFVSVYEGMLKQKNLFVVMLENNIVATYRLISKTHRQSHVLYLGGFTVDTASKGRGIGFEILKHIKNEARANSFGRIELTVDTENRGAISLYRKVGFEIEGKLRNNYRLACTGKFYDEYIMGLLLS